MKLQLRTPKTKTRRDKAMDVAGTAVDTVRERSKALRVLIPSALVATVATLIARRRRARAAVETWATPEDEMAERATETKRNKAEATGGDDEEPPPQAPGGTARNSGAETTASAEVGDGGGSAG